MGWWLHQCEKMECNYPSMRFKKTITEVRAWMSNYILHNTMDVITYPCPILGETVLVKGSQKWPLLSQFIGYTHQSRVVWLFSPMWQNSRNMHRFCQNGNRRNTYFELFHGITITYLMKNMVVRFTEYFCYRFIALCGFIWYIFCCCAYMM